ncbi:MAG: TraR/DksA family transcriptional regulator [Parcubacteria group bacterium]|jgi:DnaK suppressor protein
MNKIITGEKNGKVEISKLAENILEEIKEKEGEQNVLLASLKEAGVGSPDVNMVATKTERVATLSGQIERNALRLKKLYLALNRIKSGTFGLCINCGGEISVERLKARPEASRCILCAQKMENGFLRR